MKRLNSKFLPIDIHKSKMNGTDINSKTIWNTLYAPTLFTEKKLNAIVAFNWSWNKPVLRYEPCQISSFKKKFKDPESNWP